MKKKAKLLATSLFTIMVTGIVYSNTVVAATGCAIISGTIYCW